MKTTGIRIWILACSLLLATPAFSQLQVWPGDANNDGRVDAIDVLYLGLGYNTQGIARNTQGTVWQANPVGPWNNFLPDSTNYAYLDCDGNGIIDEDDLSAITENYDSTHTGGVVDSFPVPNAQSPVFYFSNLPDSIHAGDTVTVDVFAGTNALPAEFFGVAFTFNYDPTNIVDGSIFATPDSLINSPVERVLFLSVNDTTASTLTLALSRRANTGGTSGTPIILAGSKLVSISFIIEDNLIGKTTPAPLVLSLSNINMVSQHLAKSSSNGAQVNLPFSDIVAAAPSLSLPHLRVYPQPVSGVLMIEGLPEKGMLTLTDLSGKAIMDKAIVGNSLNSLDCSHLSTGMYLLHIETDMGSTVRKILVD